MTHVEEIKQAFKLSSQIISDRNAEIERLTTAQDTRIKMKEAKRNCLKIEGFTPLKSDRALLDEIKIGGWFHIELMNDGSTKHGDGKAFYWFNMGPMSGNIWISPNGEVTLEIQSIDHNMVTLPERSK